MTKAWSVAEAKAQFSEVLVRSRSQPQVIARRGHRVAVVVDADEYDALVAGRDAGTARARWLRFLERAAALRDEPGDELVIPARTMRPSPFDDAAR